MSAVELYSYSRCSSCKRAEDLLAAEQVPVQKRDLFAQKLSAEELRELFERVGLTPEAVISTRSRPYRELGLDASLLTGDEIIALMAQYPALIKRPLLIKSNRVVVGFSRAAIAELASA